MAQSKGHSACCRGYAGKSVPLGMTLGAAIGAAMGAAEGDMGYWVSTGIALGVCIGPAFHFLLNRKNGWLRNR